MGSFIDTVFTVLCVRVYVSAQIFLARSSKISFVYYVVPTQELHLQTNRATQRSYAPKMASCLSRWCSNAWNKARNIYRQLKERQQQGKYFNAVNRGGLLDLEKKTILSVSSVAFLTAVSLSIDLYLDLKVA